MVTTKYVFAAIHHNYGDSQQNKPWKQKTKKKQKKTKRIKIYQSQLKNVTFWADISELLLPKRSA